MGRSSAIMTNLTLNKLKPINSFSCCPFKVGGYVVVNTLFIVAPIVFWGEGCVWSLLCYAVLSVLYSLAGPTMAKLEVYFSSDYL